MKEAHGGDIREAAEAAGVSEEAIVDFSASVNPAGLSQAARAAVERALDRTAQYPDPRSASLRRALAEHHGIDPSEVIPANGSTEIIHLLPALFKPRSALIVEPAFSEYRASLELAGCRVDYLVLEEARGFALDTRSLAERVSGHEIVYIANPANPTGALAPKETMMEAARICAHAGAVLVADEAFADFTEGCSIKREAAASEDLIVLRSMTKFFSMAGLRLGYAIAHRRTIEALYGLIPPWSVNTPAAAAAEASLRDARYIEQTLGQNAREREALATGLAAIPGLKVFAGSANFVMARTTRGGPDAPYLKRALLDKGILIRDLSGFRGCGPGFFRLSVRAAHDNRSLIDALGEVMAQYRRRGTKEAPAPMT